MLYIFFGIIFLIAAYQLGNYYLDSAKEKQEADNLASEVIVWEKPDKESEIPDRQNEESSAESQESKEESVIPESIDFNKLWEENEEIRAWLYCPDTVISYPVVHTTDNDKYLRKNLALQYSNAGTLFIETKNNPDFSDWNTIIYGHNMKNGSMFKTITYYGEEAYYKEHPVMYLYTAEKKYEIQLIAGCVVDAAESEIYQLGLGEDSGSNSQEKQNLLDKLIKKSTFTSAQTYTAADHFVTLSTCFYEYENARYVLIGKLVEW